MKAYTFDIDSYIGYPISKQWVAAQLKKAGGKPVTVRVNSYGGDVQTALDIRQQFIDHGNVTVYIYGMTASAATILAMGAKEICMSRYALMLIHSCSQFVELFDSMNAEELEKTIAGLLKAKGDLEQIDSVIAALYAARTGKKASEMAAVMKEGRWLTAEECLSLGLCDKLIEEGKPEELTDRVRHQFAACGLPLPAQTEETAQSNLSIKSNQSKESKESNESNETNEAAEAPAHGEKSRPEGIFERILQALKLSKNSADMNEHEQTQQQKATPQNSPATSEMEEKINLLQEENKKLRAQVAALQKADGEETPSDAPKNDGATEQPTALSMLQSIRHAL